MSWIIGWGMNLRYVGISAPVARAWASFIIKLFSLFGI
jgi:hypothetical protein